MSKDIITKENELKLEIFNSFKENALEKKINFHPPCEDEKNRLTIHQIVVGPIHYRTNMLDIPLETEEFMRNDKDSKEVYEKLFPKTILKKNQIMIAGIISSLKESSECTQPVRIFYEVDPKTGGKIIITESVNAAHIHIPVPEGKRKNIEKLYEIKNKITYNPQNTKLILEKTSLKKQIEYNQKK